MPLIRGHKFVPKAVQGHKMTNGEKLAFWRRCLKETSSPTLKKTYRTKVAVYCEIVLKEEAKAARLARKAAAGK